MAEINLSYRTIKEKLESIILKVINENLVSSWSSTTNNTRYPSEKLVKDSLDGKANSTHEHSNVLSSSDDGDIQIYTNGTSQPSTPLGAVLSSMNDEIDGKAESTHTHSGYASSSHTHSTWSSTSITNGTLYYNSAIRLCSLRYSRTFNSATANTMYEWGQLIPSGYRPKYMISGSGNRNGATITIDSDGHVYGRFAIAFSSSTDFYYHIMWHY